MTVVLMGDYAREYMAGRLAAQLEERYGVSPLVVTLVESMSADRISYITLDDCMDHLVEAQTIEGLLAAAELLEASPAARAALYTTCRVLGGTGSLDDVLLVASVFGPDVEESMHLLNALQRTMQPTTVQELAGYMSFSMDHGVTARLVYELAHQLHRDDSPMSLEELDEFKTVPYGVTWALDDVGLAGEGVEGLRAALAVIGSPPSGNVIRTLYKYAQQTGQELTLADLSLVTETGVDPIALIAMMSQVYFTADGSPAPFPVVAQAAKAITDEQISAGYIWHVAPRGDDYYAEEVAQVSLEALVAHHREYGQDLEPALERMHKGLQASIESMRFAMGPEESPIGLSRAPRFPAPGSMEEDAVRLAFEVARDELAEVSEVSRMAKNVVPKLPTLKVHRTPPDRGDGSRRASLGK